MYLEYPPLKLLWSYTKYADQHKAFRIVDKDYMFAFAITNTKTGGGGHAGQRYQ